ncbi:hypothetical protein RIVM261_075500 [Rivularia sp. IAM M-261]|nr:hypothetical protein RIVM261_075500 [Rivularia sp. IAM M-261]
MKIASSGYAYFLAMLVTLLALNFFSTGGLTNAQQTQYFSCKNKQGIWTTVMATKQGERNLIHWDSEYFKKSGYTPKTRCNQVTGRLNNYFDDTSEQSISSGRMNNLPVICITSSNGGSCQKLLYTLKPDQDGERAIDLLIQHTSSDYNPPTLREGSCHTYLSLNALLEGKPKAKKICN